MDYSILLAAGEAFAASLAFALFCWSISWVVAHLLATVRGPSQLRWIKAITISRFAVGLGIHRGSDLTHLQIGPSSLLGDALKILFEQRVLLLCWILLSASGAVCEPGHLPAAWVPFAVSTFALSVLLVVLPSSIESHWIAVFALVALTAFLWIGAYQVFPDRIEGYSEFQVLLSAIAISAFTCTVVLFFFDSPNSWRALFGSVFPLTMFVAYCNDNISLALEHSAGWLSIVTGALLVFAFSMCWGQFRKEDVQNVPASDRLIILNLRASAGLRMTLELCLMLGYAGFIAVYGIHILDRDAGLFSPSTVSKAALYLMFLWNVVVEQVPFLGVIAKSTGSLFGLPFFSEGLGDLAEQALAQAVRWWLGALALLSGLAVVGIAVRSASRQRSVRFSSAVRSALQHRALDAVHGLLLEATTGGRAYQHAAIVESDRAIASRRVPAEFDAWPAEPSGGLFAPLLGYLVAASSVGELVRREFLLKGSVTVLEHLYRRTRLYWPALQNHLAVSSPIRLQGIVEMLRAAVAEWSEQRVPRNFASTMNLLGIELARLAFAQWEDDESGFGELSDLLDESAGYLRNALVVLEVDLQQNDAAAVHHNLGVIEFMRGRIKQDPTHVHSARRHLLFALDQRHDANDFDAAASHLFLALAHGLLTKLSGDDAHSVDVFHHAGQCVSIYQHLAGRTVYARENLVVGRIHAANLAMSFGFWSLALTHLRHAKLETDVPEMNGGKRYKFGIFVRYAYAATRLAQDELEQAHSDRGNRRERTRRNLQRANRALNRILRPQADWIVGIAPHFADEERDIRSLYLLGGYWLWVQAEFQRTYNNSEFEIVGFTQTVTRLLHSGLEWGYNNPDGGLLAPEERRAQIEAAANEVKEMIGGG